MKFGTRVITIGFYGREIQYDRNYGIDKKKGWSCVVNGRVVCQFERWFLVALWKVLMK